MPSQLASSSGCCQPCDSEPIVVNIPGPQGEPGTNGTNGVDGIDSFTYTTAPFFVPALGSFVLVFVDNTDFLPESVAGQFFVSIQGLGYMQVLSVDGLQLTLQNPAAGVLGIANAIPTTLIPTGSLITLAGAIGPTGAAGAAGGAPTGASYICRTGDGTLTNETALDLLAAGYMKTAGSGGSGVVSTVATVPVADISGTLPIAKGGTGVSTTPTNGQLLIGNGSGFTLATLTQGSGITITPGAGSISIASTSPTPFNYVTFTRRVSGTIGAGVPLIASGDTKNPFSSGDFGSGSWSTLDPSSAFTAATGKFATPYTGYYRIDLNLILLGQGGTAQVIVSISKNGSNVLTSRTFNVTNAAQSLNPVCMNYIDYSSVVGDTYDVAITSTSNGLYVDNGSSISVHRIQA
jgi:hypothetical protein